MKMHTILISQASKLSVWLADKLSSLDYLDKWVLNLSLCFIVAAATEVTSNTATATLLMPIMANLVSRRCSGCGDVRCLFIIEVYLFFHIEVLLSASQIFIIFIMKMKPESEEGNWWCQFLVLNKIVHRSSDLQNSARLLVRRSRVRFPLWPPARCWLGRCQYNVTG